MGKTARWLRGLLSGKKVRGSDVVAESKPEKVKKKWGFVRSFRDRDHSVQSVGEERRGPYLRDGSSCSSYVDSDDHSKHAIAVAAATAAVAEAAVAAAQAAVAVVRLTSGGRGPAAYFSGVRREAWAAVKIQAMFRGYLARRALRALKALVKLQALVRGHIVRKQAAQTLRCMQALVRVQARVSASRMQVSDHLHPLYKGYQAHPDPATPEKYESRSRSGCINTKHDRLMALKRNSSKHKSMDILDLYKTHVGGQNWLDHSTEDHREIPTKPKPRGRLEDEKIDKILEIDTGKPQFNAKQRINSFHSSHSPLASDQNSQSIVTCIDSPSKDSVTAQLSITSPPSVTYPHIFSASSMIGIVKEVPPTPAKSDGSSSFYSGYSDYPNYMAYTESSRAKVRSHSAPKQRPEFEKSHSTKRALSVYGFGDLNASASQRSSYLKATFMSKAYPGSGRLDRLGMPVQEEDGQI